ncbi:MAG: Hsp33 family molecular chaperone HslO [Gammaproteobacteria bacterium]|nr:Hsp33 family molecular chaperone HslO [Gammaproteobacteria bacterium]
MPAQDLLNRFVFEQDAVRGELIQLGPALQPALARQSYPEPVAGLLNQAFAAVCLLSATIKYRGATTLQVNGTGPVKMMLAQTTDELRFRGLAHWQASESLNLLGEGRMQITIDRKDQPERYQSLVPFEGGSLSHALEHYFDQSEQLPTRFWLAADGQRAGGLMLQQMPGAVDSSGWEHLQVLAETVTDAELLELDAESLIYRLFNQERVRLFEPAVPSFGCNCSSTRSERAVRTLSYREALDLLAERGEIEICCEFCDARYRFNSRDLERIYTRLQSSGPSELH